MFKGSLMEQKTRQLQLLPQVWLKAKWFFFDAHKFGLIELIPYTATKKNH